MVFLDDWFQTIKFGYKLKGILKCENMCNWWSTSKHGSSNWPMIRFAVIRIQLEWKKKASAKIIFRKNGLFANEEVVCIRRKHAISNYIWNTNSSIPLQNIFVVAVSENRKLENIECIPCSIFRICSAHCVPYIHPIFIISQWTFFSGLPASRSA